MAVADEKVLVFPRSLFERLGVFQGFSADVDRYLPTILDKKNNSFQPRAQAETNPDFKQIIPYVVITDGKTSSIMFAARRPANSVWSPKDQSASADTSMTKITRSLQTACRRFKTLSSGRCAKNFLFKVHSTQNPSA
jgi:hypothetical protein